MADFTHQFFFQPVKITVHHGNELVIGSRGEIQQKSFSLGSQQRPRGYTGVSPVLSPLSTARERLRMKGSPLGVISSYISLLYKVQSISRHTGKRRSRLALENQCEAI
ncbi:hypothetical protein [Sinomicrobium pectinilyticum]|uniref:hypothetical protein n=1 Tax=Sinomicrobium pectinilyticum TaxID=1084421 RepID=UPI0011CD7327|nr:hypothetical protein [Sinomicrobium pectinilyticum]